MPKKLGTNSKAEAARERKGVAELEKKERDSREQEERYWKEAEGPKTRSAKKRDEEAEKRAEAAARRAENRKIVEQEQLELEKLGRKPDPKVNRVSAPVPKVTEAELSRRREEEQIRLAREAEAAKKRQSRTADEEEYERMVLISNTNRDDSVIEARSVAEAIAKMVVTDVPLPPDRHPERRLKASFKAFEEAELTRLKEEKPGLTHTQYRDLIWKLWKKSPDNPLNQKVSIRHSAGPAVIFLGGRTFSLEKMRATTLSIPAVTDIHAGEPEWQVYSRRKHDGARTNGGEGARMGADGIN